ncbi:MAG TPA: alcohol dehydrogenase catalytic domain-containing protein [Nitrososphaeraceae archaeon]|jgi:L-iditol 2-dehydrogenase|nr:alcohol dehydrogenase catalytic domain-containing protein [Nitrososphaeraceae archaeon]
MLPEKNHSAVFSGPKNFEIKDLPISQKNNDVLLKTLSCAVCGYDVRVFREGHKKVRPPIVLGHEICARTLNTLNLPNDQVIPEGSRVIVSPLIPCLSCHHCNAGHFNSCNNLNEIGSSINGGFADYISIPRNNILINGIIPIENNIHDDEASLIEPLSCCLNAHLNFSIPISGEFVIIIGDGPIGLIHLQISKLYGAKTIVVGKTHSRLNEAKSIGADLVLMNNEPDESVNKIWDYTYENGGKLIIVATSNPEGIDLALKLAGKNSLISLFAGTSKNKILSIDPNLLHYNQITLSGSFSSTPKVMKKAMDLVHGQKIDLKRLVTHRFSLDEIDKAFNVTEGYNGLRSVINSF